MLVSVRSALIGAVLACFSSGALAVDFGRTTGALNVSSSGSATYTIPIWTPPGPAGVQPSIAMTYSSGSGNGLGGVGWNLAAVSAISRCPRTFQQDSGGKPIDLTLNDRFCINGNRMRLASGTYGVTGSVYFTEFADYSRITAGTASGGALYFTVEAKSGLKYQYGFTADARTPVSWMLNKVYDRSGNNYVIAYFNSGNSAVPGTISWTPTSLGASTYRYQAVFGYPTIRVDFDSSFGKVGGVDIAERSRIETIQITSGGAVVRKYRFSYDTSTVTSRSRLTSAKECADDAESNCLLPIAFTYQTGATGLTAGASTPPAGSSNSLYKGRYDFNGDGKNDIAYRSGTTWWVALGANNGFAGPYNTGIASAVVSIDRFLPNGRAALATVISGSLWTYRWDDATSAFVGNNTGIATTSVGTGIDYNGDGLADLVYKLSSSNVLQVRANTSTGNGNPTFASSVTNSAALPGQWKYSGFIAYPGTGQFHSDINGDGLEDMNVRVLWVGPNEPPEGPVSTMILMGSSTGFIVPAASTWIAAGGADWPAIDFNNDGCTDRVNGTTIQIAACTGAFANNITAPATPLQVLDWDGDGKTDILVNNGGTFGVYRSTGVGFGTLISTNIPSTGTFFDADVDGDGLDDLVQVNGSSAIGYWTHTGGGTVPLYATNIPDLLSNVTDGFGVSQTVNYTSTSWSNYDKGAATNYPIQESASRVVVAQVTSSDGIGGSYNRNFNYVGARSDAGRREFVGFQRFDVTDARNGIIVRDYFEQSFPVRGMLSQREVMQPGGAIAISRLVPVNTFATLDATANNQRYFPYSSGSTATQYAVEVGGTWNGALVRTVTSANMFETTGGSLYDQTITTTEPASGANGVTAGGSWVARTYSPTANLVNDTNNWCLGRPGQVQQINSTNSTYAATITRTTNITWDAVKCRPTQSIDEPIPVNGPLQVTTDIGYDAFGNVNSTTVTGIGMTARKATSTYSDATFTTGQFPLSATNPLLQTTTFAWNYELGAPASATDPNGIAISWLYDAFARKTRENHADGTFTTWVYGDCVAYGFCLATGKTFTFQTTRDSGGARVTGDDSLLLDAFDRPISRLPPVLGDPTNNVSAYYEMQYDALGRLAQSSIPKMSKDVTPSKWTIYGYDLINRPVTISRPISEGITTLQTTTNYYDGLTTRTVDPQGKQAAVISNSFGQVARSTDHDNYYQSFDYDAFGSVKRVRDSAGNDLQTSNYNIRGLLTSRTDLDMGTWQFTPDALGETVSQLDAKSQTTSFVFDLLGRITSRTEGEGTSTFTFGTSSTAKNIGQLASMSGPGYSESHTFDSLGRPASTTVNADVAYQIDYTYNGKGQLSTVAYPGSTNGCRLTIQFGYETGFSYDNLSSITNVSNATQCGSTGEVYWQANQGNALGQLTRETLGNGLVTNRAIDAVTGWLKSIQTGPANGTGVQNLAYTWDLVGNLTSRKDVNQSSLTETFVYDNLYRLASSSLSTTGTNLTMAYNLLGNITSKSDVGTYAYDATKKHQVTSTTNGWSFAYDLNGNMTSDRGATVTWTSYNYPASITNTAQGKSSLFSYTPDRRYWKQDAYFPGQTTTIYIGGILEKVTTGTNTDYRHYIQAGGSTIVVSRQTNAVNSVFYVASDHLGSNVVFNGTSPTINASYDAFGRRRGANWTGAITGPEMTQIAGVTRRGFTGQTMLDNLELIHMNGRVQDLLLGRFISADPFITEPMNTQNYNRYSYVNNNPLSAIDPSGFADKPPRWWESHSFPPATCNNSTNMSACARFMDDLCTSYACTPNLVEGPSQATGAWYANDPQRNGPITLCDLQPTCRGNFEKAEAWISDQLSAHDYATLLTGQYIERPVRVSSPNGMSIHTSMNRYSAAFYPLAAAGMGRVNAGLDLGMTLATAAIPIPGLGGLRAAGAFALKGMGNIGSHGILDAGVALGAGEKWLGASYKEIGPGVFRSADGLRQFRMTDADLLGAHGNIGSHVHFEALNSWGDVIENLHIPVTP